MTLIITYLYYQRDPKNEIGSVGRYISVFHVVSKQFMCNLVPGPEPLPHTCREFVHLTFDRSRLEAPANLVTKLISINLKPWGRSEALTLNRLPAKLEHVYVGCYLSKSV
jgi:hypothetical protein